MLSSLIICFSTNTLFFCRSPKGKSFYIIILPFFIYSLILFWVKKVISVNRCYLFTLEPYQESYNLLPYPMMDQYYFYSINTELQLFGKEMIIILRIRHHCHKQGWNYMGTLCQTILARVCMAYFLR